jgi:hypothetical protein
VKSRIKLNVMWLLWFLLFVKFSETKQPKCWQIHCPFSETNTSLKLTQKKTRVVVSQRTQPHLPPRKYQNVPTAAPHAQPHKRSTQPEAPPRNPAPEPQLSHKRVRSPHKSPKPIDRRRIDHEILPALPRRPDTRASRRPARTGPQHHRRGGGADLRSAGGWARPACGRRRRRGRGRRRRRRRFHRPRKP